MRKTKLGTVMGKEIPLFESDDEEGVYGEEGVEVLLDDDELSPSEAAFMKGYDEAGVAFE